MQKQFSLIKFQEELSAKFLDIRLHSIGKHARRSYNAASRKAREVLQARGYDKDSIRHILNDADDMAILKMHVSH